MAADPPVPGAIDWLKSLLDWPEQWGMSGQERTFDICIYSSRSCKWGGKRCMRRWLVTHGLEREYLEQIKFPTKKPAAFLTIDDRAICFDGKFPDEEALAAFEPWNNRTL